MSDTDVLKMKVADLKKELKLRGLPITGNKTELQERLQSALLDGDLSLEDTAMSEDVLLDEDVLTDEEVPVSPILEENINLTTNSENKTESVPSATIKEKIEIENQTKKPVVLKRKPITLSTSDTSSDEAQITSTLSDEPSQEKIKKIEITTEEIDIENNAHSNDKQRVLKVNQLTVKERMEMRAKKFGVSSSTASNDNKTIIQEKINMSDPKTIEALKKRAERFGVTTAPQISAIEKEEKLQKRKERFGLTGDVNKVKDNTITTNSNPDYAEKARLRLERFKTATAN